ncbi:flavin reductase family protein [Clostridium oceanicum]|uniref:Flavin reductase family protein n=1 Tax=Clostridium oceanicum TaxID=1543 RepID=A0ABP3UTJ9_9CLOT
MSKQTLGNKSVLYPYPVTILGANVNGKANFMALGFVGIVNTNPGMIALGVNRNHHTNKGIFENKTFSINISSQDMLEVTDYVGLTSGEKIDKSEIFDVFYGKVKTAPMIKDCPLTIECKVIKTLDLGGADDIIIGEIIESYCDEEFLTKGNPDIEKMKPAVFSMYENRYFGIGEYLGKGWSMGKEYKSEK